MGAGWGGLAPYPRRCGGAVPRLRILLDSLNRSTGRAIDTSTTSYAFVKNMAIARLLDGAWATNERLGNQSIPSKMDATLGRWETILSIRTDETKTKSERRTTVSERFYRFGSVFNRNYIIAELERRLGSFFVAVEFIGDVSLAEIDTNEETWSSTLAHVLVLLQKPTGSTEGDLYEAAAKVGDILDPLLPAWTYFDWYREPESGGINVVGGPSEGGFFLDDDHNLDNNVFDE